MGFGFGFGLANPNPNQVGCDAVEVLPRLVEALGQREMPSEMPPLRPPSEGLVGFS